MYAESDLKSGNSSIAHKPAPAGRTLRVLFIATALTLSVIGASTHTSFAHRLADQNPCVPGRCCLGCGNAPIISSAIVPFQQHGE